MLGKIVTPFIFLFLFSASAFGQGDKLEDGYNIFKYPNGTVSSEGTIRDGLPDGYWKSYFVTGVKKSEGKRRNFMLDSIWVFYSQTGDTLEKIDYLSGKKSGYYLKYKRDNLKGLYIWSRELYAADKREGLAWQYYSDGSVKLIIPYKNGKKDGLSKEFDEHGVIITLYEYSNDFLVSRERINRIDKDGHKQGEWRDFYDDGTLMRELTYVNDQIHGYYREYNEKGVLTSIMLYDSGVLVEESVDDDPEIEIVNRYDTSGNLIYTGPFRNSIPVGVHREYDGNGSITNSIVYNDSGLKMSEGVVDEEGNRQGEWKIVFPDGSVKERGNYIDNRRNGPWSFYDSEAKLVQRGAYRNGRAEGQWVWFYNDGSVLREEDYYQGRRDGSFVEYSKSGELLIKGEYADGEKNGIWIYTVGDHREEGNYIIGLRDGVWKYFDNEENLLYKGSFVQDNPDGYHTYFWENGRVKEEQYYSMGIMQRTWKKYDEEGAVLMTISYKDGVERRINGIKVNLPDSEVKLIK